MIFVFLCAFGSLKFNYIAEGALLFLRKISAYLAGGLEKSRTDMKV